MNIFLSILVISIIVFGIDYILVRWINPWNAERFLNKIILENKIIKPNKKKDFQFEIVIDSTGLKISSLKMPTEAPIVLNWSKVSRVIAFKRDHFSVDCICILFELDNNTCLEVDEEMKGWDELTASMPNHLPGCKQWNEWFSTVAFPAFATNETELFIRNTKQ